MIEILEVKDQARIEEILGTEQNDNILLEMTERDSSMGYCVINIADDTVFISKLNIDGYDFSEKPDMEQHFILDSLVRSAASYGETKGVKKIETRFADFFDFFKKMGFTVDTDNCSGPISLIVNYH